MAVIFFVVLTNGIDSLEQPASGIYFLQFQSLYAN